MEVRSEAKFPAEAIANSIDLLTQILLKVPAKPLIKFKCVSKQWLSLISNPQFCLSHTRHHHTPYPTPTALLLTNFITPNQEFKIVPLKHHTIPKVPFFHYLNVPPFYIKQSCNGLLLCSSSSYDLKFMAECIYYICNPTTKQVKKFCIPCFKEYVVSVCMAFDPLKSNHYKLICIRTVDDKISYHIDMYSSKTDSWSTLGITFTPPNRMEFSSAVFCNGAVHWLCKGETSLYFDVDRECFNTMPNPNLAQRNVGYFGESRGHLHLIVNEQPSCSQFDVLEMAVDYSGWFVRYHVNVNLDAVRIAFPDLICNRFSVVHVIRAQKEEDSIVVVLVDNKAIAYNVHDGTSKKLCDSNSYTWLNTSKYFEILTPI